MTNLERLKRAVGTVPSENQRPIEDALHVLGQMENNGLVNSLELYDAYLERSANETNNADAQLTHQKILTQLRFFNTTDIPFEQVANFSKECRNILDLAIDFQLGTKTKSPITDFIPIYHDPDDELKLHILEIQMHNFSLLKQKDLMSLVSLFETFSAIFQSDNQVALKQTHLTAFFNYITLNLLKLKVDYGQGKLLTSLKHHLNFVKNEFNCLNLLAHEPLESDKRKVDLSLSLKQLDLIIQFKEQQYAPYYNCIKTLNSGFESLKRSVVMQSKSLKYIRKHMRQETLKLVAEVLDSSDHVVKFNERIKDLLAHRYIDESLKLTVEKFLHEILQNAIDERINKPNLTSVDKKKYASVLKRFSLKKREIFDSKLDDLSVKKETIVQLIMILFKYSNQNNSSKVRLSSSRIIELAQMFDKYELWIQSKQPNEKTKQIELKIGVDNSNQTTIMIDPSDDDLINSLTTNLPKKLALSNQDNFYRLLKEKYAIDLDSGLDRLVQYLTDLCDEFNLEKLKSQHLGKFNSKRMGKAPKQESMIAFDQFLERIYLSDSHAGSFRCKLRVRNSDNKPLSSEEEMAVRNGNAIYVLRNNRSEQLDIFYKLQQTTDDTAIYVETLAKPDNSVSVDSSQNESKEPAMIRMKEKALYQLLSAKFSEKANISFVDNDSESIKCLSEYLAIKTKNLVHTCFDDNKLKSYRFEAEIIFEKLKAIKTKDTKALSEKNEMATSLSENLEKLITDKFRFTFDEQQGIDYSAVLQNLNKFAANMDLLNQLKLLLNARIDIPKGLLDEVFEKLQNNFRLSKKSFNFDAMFDLIQIYEKNDEILTFQVNHEVAFLDQLKSHLKANSEAINQSLNNLNELIKNQQEQSSNDLNENKLQILLNQMVLNRLFNLNEQLYRKLIIKKCHMTLHKRLEETLMSNSNSNNRSKIEGKDFTLSTYYDMRNRLDQSIKNLFQQIDQFCDLNYLEAKRISIYTHLVDDLSEEIEFQPNCAPNEDGPNFLAEISKHFQSVRNQIDFFKERCIIKLSGLAELDDLSETQMKTKIQDLTEQCVIKRVDLIFESANETQEQFAQRLEQLSTGHLFAILIKKLDSNQHEIYYVHETTNEIKNLAIEDTDQNRLITAEINPEKSHTQSSANFEFIYDAVFYNDGLIYSAPSLSMFYSMQILNIFSKFLEELPSQNLLSIVNDDKQFERLLRYLEAFKLLVESLHQSDRQILIQIKRSTRTLVNGISSCEELNKSTDKQPNQQRSRLLLTLEYFQLFADMIDAKMQLTVDLLRMECKKLLQSGTIEYKNQLLNFAARHKPKLELCQPDELSKLVTKLAEFLFTIDYRSSTSVDLDDISIELARFEETLAIQSPVECLREMRDQIEHIKVYERLFSINDDDTLTIGKEQSDQRLNDELKKQNTEIRNGKILTVNELLSLVDLVVDKLNKATQINEEKSIGNSDKMQYEETLTNQLIKNLRLTVLENKNTTTDESLIIEPVIELERRLGKLNTGRELNTIVLNEFYKFIKDSLRNAIEKKHELLRDEFKTNQNDIERKLKEISNIYWKNIEQSNLYNKERERAYLNVCLVKIIELEKKLFSDRNRSITDIHFETLSQISEQINQLQTNPDKIELTKVLFSSLNKKVNGYLLELFSNKKTDDEFQLILPQALPKTTLSQLIEVNDGLENIVKLFNQLADNINEESNMSVDEIETKDFLKGFNTIFEYLSWHNVGLCKDKKDELNKLYETLKKSVRKIESKQSKSNELERLKQLIYLRTNESLVQEELNMMKEKCMKRCQMVFELIQLNKVKVDEFEVRKNAIQLSQIISDNLSKINLEQSENELEELYMAFNNYSIVSSQENQTTNNSSQHQSYNYDSDDMNQIFKCRFKMVANKNSQIRSKIVLHPAINFSELKVKIYDATKQMFHCKSEKITLIPCRSTGKWIGILVDIDEKHELVQLKLIDAFTDGLSELNLLVGQFNEFRNRISLFDVSTGNNRLLKTQHENDTGPFVIENLLRAVNLFDQEIEGSTLSIDSIDEAKLNGHLLQLHIQALNQAKAFKSSHNFIDKLKTYWKNRTEKNQKKACNIEPPITSRDNKFNQDTQSKQPDIVNIMLAEIKKSLADIDRKTQTESPQNLILFKIKTLNEFAYEKACNLTTVQKEHFAIEIDKLRKEIVDSLFKVCAQSNSGDDSSAVLREKLGKILMESNVEDWKYELDQLTLSQFSETLLKRCGLTFEIFEVDLNRMTEALKRYDELAKNIWFKELDMIEFKDVIVDALSDVNSNIDSLINQFGELTSLVKNFLLSQSDDTDSNALNEFVLFKKHSSKCLRNLVRLKRFKSAIQSAIFFLGVENFLKIVQIFYNKIGILKLNSVNKQPNDVQINLEKLIDLFQVLPNMRSAEQPIQIMIKFDPTKWQYYFNLQRLELAIFSYFECVLNNLEFKGLPQDSVCRKNEENGFDMIIKHVESKYHVEMKILADIGEKLRTHLDAIDKNEYLSLNEKEDVLKFLSNKVSLEVKKQPIAMISPKELESFMKLLISTRVCKTLTESMKHIDDDDLDESNETDDDDSSLATSQIDASNKRLFIHAVGFQSLQIVKPFLERVWIIDYLKLEDYLLKTDQENLVQYLDQIKTIHNESIMYNLIELIHKCCKNEKRISQSITLALEKFAKQNWILNEEVLKLLDQLTSSNQWHKTIEAYTNEQRYKKRDLRELFRIMQKDAAEGINKSVASMLDNRQLLIKDIERIIKLRQRPAEGFEELKNKSIDEWSVDDIKKWANYIKGNKMLENKKNVEQAIAVVCQAVKLFKGYFPRDSQLISIWLFLNPEINRNEGKIGKIATGEGKSIIVAAIAAIKALNCERVDVVTSSNVLAIRDADENKAFFDMFDLQTSNNCDEVCEKGDPSGMTSEQVRKLRYCSTKGPVDIVYGETGSFERDILFTEFNRNDSKLDIISARMKDNAVASVIVDEVDSMFLDKANMVLYLSHSVDTLRALERIFVIIWQLVNQFIMVADDDTVSSIADLILEQIGRNEIDIPRYETGSSCDYINMMHFIKRRLPSWIRSAIHVRYMSPNDTYVLAKDSSKSNNDDFKITVMDKETGTEQGSTRWSNGVHQFLQLKHTRRLTPESLKAVFLSNMNYYKRYGKNIAGVTGTLGTQVEQKILSKIYNVGFFEVPRFKPELFIQLPGKMYSDRTSWLDGILETVNEQIKDRDENRRAVLIICDNVSDVLDIKERLRSDYPDAMDYKSSYENFEIDEMRPGDVIVATNLAGRGTDLKTSDALESNSGLHVIVCKMPANVRIEAQAFGRTARKGNRGSGQYVLYNARGLTIEQLVEMRNSKEKERLDRILISEMPKILVEECLLNGTSSSNQNDLMPSCVGFAKIYEDAKKELERSDSYDEAYINAQLYSLKNRWAFWLDSISDLLGMVSLGNTKQIIVDKFNEFKKGVEDDLASDNWRKLMREPAEFVKLAKTYRDDENWTDALKYYSEAAKDPFYSHINYYVSACRLNIDYQEGLAVKRAFKSNLVGVKKSIEKELQFLMSATQLARQISEQNRKNGLATHGNEYEKELKEKSTIWNIFISSISNAIGSEITPRDLAGNKFLNEERAKDFIKYLNGKNRIKPERVSKSKFEFDDNYMKKIKPESESRIIELPELFNNEKTKTNLYRYLKEKINERRARKDDCSVGKMDLETFKSDLKSRSIFVPYLDVYIEKACQKGFLIKRNDQNYSVNFENIFQKPAEPIKKKNNTNKADEQNTALQNQYRFFDHQEMEKNYSDQFKAWHKSFRKLFIRTLVVQITDTADSSNNQAQRSEGDFEEFLSLNTNASKSDFQIVEKEETATESLWAYLCSIGLIKPAKMNVGLISSEDVKERLQNIKKDVKDYLLQRKIVNNDNEQLLNEAVGTLYNVIDQTIGELKKIPDDKTITSFLNIEKSYFFQQGRQVPESLIEFIEMAIEVVFRLEEKKDPPNWYEIAAVIALGVVQVVAGVLIKTFVPFVGSVIGDFLLSTGIDDICFGIQSAITGEFSWEAYWENKKQSMISSAILSVATFGFSMLKSAAKFKSISKAWNIHKLSKAQRLTTVGGNVAKYVGKEIAKNLAMSIISSIVSYGVDKVFDADESSESMNVAVDESIKQGLDECWTTIDNEMDRIYKLLDGDQRANDIINDCVSRRLQNLYEMKWFRNMNKYAGPAIQGFFNVMAGGNKGVLTKRLNFIPSLANIGVSTYELTQMVSEFSKSLVEDLQDAVNRNLANQRQQNAETHNKREFKDFKDKKKQQILQTLQRSYNQKLNNSITKPLINTAANQAISWGLEKLLPTTRAEAASEDIGLLDAALSEQNGGLSEERYVDDWNIYKAEAQEIDISQLKTTSVPIANLQADINGENSTLDQVLARYGDKVRVFMDRDGNIYVRRPSTTNQFKSIANDKAAGIYEKQVVPNLVGCQIREDSINSDTTQQSTNDEQRHVLSRDDGQREVTLITRKNENGVRHMQVIFDGQIIELPSNLNKNDCYYASILIANELAKGKSLQNALEMVKDRKEILKLRNSVVNVLKNDKNIVQEMRTGFNVDAREHYTNQIGQRPTRNNLSRIEDHSQTQPQINQPINQILVVEEEYLDQNLVQFTQASISSQTSDHIPLAELINNMKATGDTWRQKYPPIDVVVFTDEKGNKIYVSLDNRRLLAAKTAKIQVWARLHPSDSLLIDDNMKQRFKADTWGDAVHVRCQDDRNQIILGDKEIKLPSFDHPMISKRDVLIETDHFLIFDNDMTYKTNNKITDFLRPGELKNDKKTYTYVRGQKPIHLGNRNVKKPSVNNSN